MMTAGMIMRDIKGILVEGAVATVYDLERRREATINAALAGGQSTDDAISTADRIYGERLSSARDYLQVMRDRQRPATLEHHQAAARPWWQFWP